MQDVLIVLCACPNRDEAVTLARVLVERELAACVNVLPGVESVYRWQGQVETASEVLLFAKTTSQRFEALRTYLEAAHSYDVPEIIACPVVNGSSPYLDWVVATVQPLPKES